MKESHDEAKNRILLAAAEHGMTQRLDQHIGLSVHEAQFTSKSPADNARLHERIAEALKRERAEMNAYFHEHPTIGWQMPQPMAMKGERPPVKLTPAASSSGQPASTVTSGQVTLTENPEATGGLPAADGSPKVLQPW